MPKGKAVDASVGFVIGGAIVEEASDGAALGESALQITSHRVCTFPP